MADEQKQEQVDVQAKAKETQAGSQQAKTESEIRAEIEAQFKAEIAGLNRKVSEATKKATDLEKSKMTEAEIIEANKKELEKLRADTQREKLTYKLGRTIAKLGLPEELTDILLSPPEDDEKLDDYTGKLDSIFKAFSAKAVEELRKSNTRTTPLTKWTGKVMTRAEFNKLDPTERTKQWHLHLTF